MKPHETIALFDEYLFSKGLTLDAVVVGGSALDLLGVISRQTKDCDVLHPALSDEIAAAAREFAAEQRARGASLAEDWLNNGPASLMNDLPEGWVDRLQPVWKGRAIALQTLGRLDLLRSKMFAWCDRDIDYLDCLALRPTMQELAQIAPWLEARDGNPDWPAHVRERLAVMAEAIRDGV